MLNDFTSKLSYQLTTLHKLVYGKKNDARYWFPLFSIGYFHHQEYVAVTRSSNQYQTLAGIEIGMDN